MKIHHSLINIICVSVLLYNCSTTNKENSDQQSVGNTTENSATEMSSSTTVSDTISLIIESNDLMKFNKDELSVTEDTWVKLTLVHNGKMAINVMGHNWVLLALGTDVASFADKAIEAKDTQYIPKNDNSILANTKLIGGGEQTTIVFKAPKAGYYTYICSFPGHWASMKGTLVVSPK